MGVETFAVASLVSTMARYRTASIRARFEELPDGIRARNVGPSAGRSAAP
jgi:hypothetical protein